MRTQVRVLEPIQVWNAIIAVILDSIVVSIPACHAGDRGSIPRRGDNLFLVTGKIEIDHVSMISRKKKVLFWEPLVFFVFQLGSVKSTDKLYSALLVEKGNKNVASAGNRTRAARVAGEHSTTEPPMLTHQGEGLTLCGCSMEIEGSDHVRHQHRISTCMCFLCMTQVFCEGPTEDFFWVHICSEMVHQTFAKQEHRTNPNGENSIESSNKSRCIRCVGPH